MSCIAITTSSITRCLFAFLLLSSVTFGQNYKQVQVNQRLARKGTSVKRFAKTPSEDAESRQLYVQYFTDYFFPALQQSTPESLGEIGNLRLALFKDYLWPAAPAVQRDLTRRAEAYATAVLENPDDYHPAVSYNAVLVLGGLDAQYGSDSASNPRPASPLPAATTRLSQIVRDGVAGKVPLHLHTGALIGLERHARFARALPREARNPMFRVLLEAAKQTEFPPGTDEEVQGWIRQKACQALANIGSPGPQGGLFAKTLVEVVKDESLPVDARIAIAGLLRKMKFEGARGVDFASLYKQQQRLASVLAEEDRATAAEYKEYQLSRRRGPSLEQTIDQKRFFIEDSEVKLQRNYFANRLREARRGMNAIKPVGGGQAAAVDQYVAIYKETYDKVTNNRVQDLDIADAMVDMADRIAQLTPPELAAGSGTKGGSGTKEGSGSKEGSGAKPGSDTKPGSDKKP